jgi:predicted pyridoxine 5'-phosphate oxidase superfamily flavin-nucleotide-binding protein
MENKRLSYWHHGELTIQKRVGTDQRMADIAPHFIRELMPQQHRDFFENLAILFIAYANYQSQVQASVIFGFPGFITSPTEHELIINTQHSMGDGIQGEFYLGQRIGLLGLVFESKRRNRLNAVITDINQKYIRVKVLQSYGNCPKYIQPKTFQSNPQYGYFQRRSTSTLSIEDKQLISQADTFFIASQFDDGITLNNRGPDMSHRGGETGFIKINSKGKILIEDYVGNGFFNTLGNITQNPLASLLFCDWKKGHILQLTVKGEILWDTQHQPNANKVTGLICFTPLAVNSINNGLSYLEKE